MYTIIMMATRLVEICHQPVCSCHHNMMLVSNGKLINRIVRRPELIASERFLLFGLLLFLLFLCLASLSCLILLLFLLRLGSIAFARLFLLLLFLLPHLIWRCGRPFSFLLLQSVFTASSQTSCFKGCTTSCHRAHTSKSSAKQSKQQCYRPQT